MEPRNAERLKSYLELITRKHGLETALETAVAETRSGLEATEAPEVQDARKGAESLLRDRAPTQDEMFGLEAIILPKLRPAVDIVDGKFTVTHQLWRHLSENEAIRKRIEAIVPSIGRIELPGNRQYPYGGTGFVVGNGLLMTNRHVAAIFANGLGSRTLAFKPGFQAGIDFLRERGRPTGPTLMVKRVAMIHPYWDMAILEVEGLPAGHEPLKLSLLDVSDVDGREIAVIGYPAFDPRNDAAEQDQLFDREYGIKRLQPGQLHGRADTASFGKMVSAAAHDCSTLGGNSGSAVFDLETGEVVALHFGGRYQERNFGVPAFELARDGRVVDAGVRFAGTPAGGSPPWADWWTRADTTERIEVGEPGASGTQAPPATAPRPAQQVRTTDGAISIEIPLHITVRLGAPSTTAAREAVATEGVEDITEALVEPFRDTRYQSRTGFDEKFLGPEIPMPEAADPSVLAQTKDGGRVLDYQNFSIKMHAARRLALVTASNVTADPKLKRPEKNRDYTRRGLSGLGENDQERWFTDPRLKDEFQLPDVFFTKDRKAFDKGHIIRREDVAWGTTYDNLRRANGDTYHVTNCSPQTAEFNRSTSGQENWGDLENQVLAGAAQERLVLFAGPVLDPADTIFVGTGGGGQKIRAKIPSRFWKVVVAAVEDGIAAFGFVLEQDLSGVEFEFVVADEFVPHMYPLADIEAMTGVKFPSVVLDADQYDTLRGSELAIRAGTPRRHGNGQRAPA